MEENERSRVSKIVPTICWIPNVALHVPNLAFEFSHDGIFGSERINREIFPLRMLAVYHRLVVELEFLLQLRQSHLCNGLFTAIEYVPRQKPVGRFLQLVDVARPIAEITCDFDVIEEVGLHRNIARIIVI